MIYYKLEKFWDDEFKTLDYVNEPFNDTEETRTWLAAGFPGKFTGDMADMRGRQPSWNNRFIEFFTAEGWKDIGTSYYRMSPVNILPAHTEIYLYNT